MTYYSISSLPFFYACLHRICNCKFAYILNPSSEMIQIIKHTCLFTYNNFNCTCQQLLQKLKVIVTNYESCVNVIHDARRATNRSFYNLNCFIVQDIIFAITDRSKNQLCLLNCGSTFSILCFCIAQYE